MVSEQQSSTQLLADKKPKRINSCVYYRKKYHPILLDKYILCFYKYIHIYIYIHTCNSKQKKHVCDINSWMPSPMKKPRKSTPSLHWWLEKTTWKNGWFKSHHLDLLRPALSNKILWELHNILNLQGKLSSMRCIGFDEHMSFKPAAKNMKKDLQSLKHPSVTFHPHSHSISSSTKFGCNWIAILYQFSASPASCDSPADPWQVLCWS